MCNMEFSNIRDAGQIGSRSMGQITHSSKRIIQHSQVRFLTILLFVFGGTISIECQQTISSEEIDHYSAQDKPCLEYINVIAGLAHTKDGEPISYHTYITSDGMNVYSTYFYFRTPNKANKELSKKLRAATQVVKRESKLNSKGQKIGIRVLGIFKSNVPGVKEYEVLWTDGANLKTIRSASLPHLLQFEEPTCNK